MFSGFYGGFHWLFHQVDLNSLEILACVLKCVDKSLRKKIFFFTEHIILRNVGNAPSILAPNIPYNSYMLFQCMFAVITPSLAFGCISERATVNFLISKKIIKNQLSIKDKRILYIHDYLVGVSV